MPPLTTAHTGAQRQGKLSKAIVPALRAPSPELPHVMVSFNGLGTRQLAIWPSTLVTGVILALSVLLPLPHEHRILNIPALCLFKDITHLPCPACGLTRSFVCLGHGQWGAAITYHPLGPALFASFLLFFLWSLGPWRRAWSLRAQNLTVAGYALVLVTVWLVRLFSGTLPP